MGSGTSDKMQENREPNYTSSLCQSAVRQCWTSENINLGSMSAECKGYNKADMGSSSLLTRCHETTSFPRKPRPGLERRRYAKLKGASRTCNVGDSAPNPNVSATFTASAV